MKVFYTGMLLSILTSCVPLPPALLVSEIAAGAVIQENTKRSYYDKNYVVTKNCAKDIVRALVLDVGKPFHDINYFQMAATKLIHTKAPEGMIFALDIKTDDNNKKYKYIFSKADTSLELVMVSYSDKSSKGSINTENGAGLKKTKLHNCKIK